MFSACPSARGLRQGDGNAAVPEDPAEGVDLTGCNAQLQMTVRSLAEGEGGCKSQVAFFKGCTGMLSVMGYEFIQPTFCTELGRNKIGQRPRRCGEAEEASG